MYCKWSTDLSGFDSTIISFYTFYTSYFPYNDEMVLAYPEIDGTLMLKFN